MMDTLTSAAQPPMPVCLAQLFKRAYDGEDLNPLRDRMIAQSKSNTGDAASLFSLSTIEQLLGDQPSGLARQAEALSLHRLYRSAWPVSPNSLRVLAFKAAGDISTNTPIEFLLEGSDVVLYSLYVVPSQPLPEVPEHDIAIVTVGESDRERPVMREIERLIKTWPCPVLNRPERILQLSREGMYGLLKGTPGLFMAATVSIKRAELEMVGRGLLPVGQFLEDAAFPLIARPIGSHAGRGLVKLDEAYAIEAYLAGQPEAEFFLSPYVDYRSADGQFRKYRIIWVDGRPYPCHMAIADQWKVWYYNADMAGSPAKRAEEEQFMSAFDDGFGRRHAAVLAAMAERFGLEYVGIDCAELRDGRLIVFEGDISLVVHDMDSPDIYPYKSGPTRKLFAAFYDMLKRRSL
ncbi:MAG: hypothetical protein M3Y72_18915 [Acidobacteriota bacterium]|nr:hypothetical protein [Acidobacteriota bacterium]